MVAAALIDDGAIGRWSEQQLALGGLVAPHLLPVEVMGVLRKTVGRDVISGVEAGLALGHLLRMPVDLWPFGPFAVRASELRESLTADDGWYVALAEALGAPLVTLDQRLAAAPGPRCPIVAPPCAQRASPIDHRFEDGGPVR